MSRIDEALKQAARTGIRDDSRDGVANGPGADADAATLERYAVEAPVRPHVAARIAPLAPAATVAVADARVESVTIPQALQAKLVAGPDLSPPIIEEYRRLAAVLHDLQQQQGLKTLMVTSAAPREGKTLTIANLALTLSESYHQRVLLIDADLRRPSVHDVFGVANGPGISDLVNAGRPAVPVVQVSTHLSLLTAGRRLASPLAMLTSDRMRAVVSDMATRYDWVLLDTPPVGLLPDAQLAARLTQGVLFVIAAGVTSYALVQRAIAEVGPERVIGTVLNKVEAKLGGASDTYGSYYGASTATTGRR